jgi:hypothetical protein
MESRDAPNIIELERKRGGGNVSNGNLLQQ